MLFHTVTHPSKVWSLVIVKADLLSLEISGISASLFFSAAMLMFGCSHTLSSSDEDNRSMVSRSLASSANFRNSKVGLAMSVVVIWVIALFFLVAGMYRSMICNIWIGCADAALASCGIGNSSPLHRFFASSPESCLVVVSLAATSSAIPVAQVATPMHDKVRAIFVLLMSIV